jgi:hypothetical protein
MRRIVFAVVAIAIGAYYRWEVRAAGHPFEWGRDLNAYYDFLGRAFVQGQLYLPVQPAPQLLAQPDPYDPNSDSTYKLWDTALYRGRYYLYHGAGPAILLFAPWRLLTRHDLPENFALFLFCFGGWLFAAAALLRILSLARARPGSVMLTMMLAALGLCNSIPFLLNRTWVYEVAIGGGYFCLSGAFCLLVRSIGSSRTVWWLAGSGLLFGLAVSCRPTLIFAAAIALLYVAMRRIGAELIAFALPLCLACIGIAIYNDARFGSPFEFGVRYLLSGPFQNRIQLRLANLVPGLYYNFFCTPAFDAVFPWVRLVLRFPGSSAASLPREFFVESTAGGLFLAPFIPLALLLPEGAPRRILCSMTASGIAIIAFLALTGFVTQRYEADFLPLLVLPALASWAMLQSRFAGWRRNIGNAVMGMAIAFGLVVNLALGLSGPYDDVLRNRPAAYARIARWFSPVAELRPIINPQLDVEFSADLPTVPDGIREPLLTIGRPPFAQFLYVENGRLVLKTPQSEASTEAPPGKAALAVKYDRDSGKLAVSVNRHEALMADPGILFTAPAQVTIGENCVDPSVTAPRFGGRIQTLLKTIQ